VEAKASTYLEQRAKGKGKGKGNGEGESKGKRAEIRTGYMMGR
jgi:hypothetical protein